MGNSINYLLPEFFLLYSVTRIKNHNIKVKSTKGHKSNFNVYKLPKMLIIYYSQTEILR